MYSIRATMSNKWAARVPGRVKAFLFIVPASVVVFAYWQSAYTWRASRPVSGKTTSRHFRNILIDQVRSSETNIKSTQRPRRAFLCNKAMGRLGNVLFSYASMFGVARRKNMIPSFYDRRNVIYSLFKHPTATRTSYERCTGYKRTGNARHCAFNPKDLAFSDRHNTSMDGFYQSWMYFQDSFDEIRDEFTFTEAIQAEAVAAVRHSVSRFAGTDNLTYITVHARRSDVLESKYFQSRGFVSPNLNYYLKAMAYYRSLYTPVMFVVCSDRIEWCKTHLNFSDVVFIEGRRPAVDLCVISQGNHTIMSVGSFGWWGSFLANGATIAYKYPAREGSGFGKHFSRDRKDFFIPHWILMDAL